jgi:hypothetical protein
MSLVTESLLVGGVALELVGAGMLAHSANAESIVELRELAGVEGTAVGEPDAISTHAKLLAEKRVGFLWLATGLVLTAIGLVLGSTEGVILMGAVAAAAVLFGLLTSLFVTRRAGNRYRDQARSAAAGCDPDELPEQ